MWKGVLPAVTSKFTEDGGLDHAEMARCFGLMIEAGCDGLVCAVADAHDARQMGPRLTIVTPGIRPAGAPTHDQARAATPQEAFDAGADLLVIGRAVTHADDPVVAAAPSSSSQINS